MDDSFGCLQNEKISTKKILQEFLQKRNELYLCLPTKKNRWTSCEDQLFNVVNEFCRECPKCGRVFEYEYDYDYDDEQLQEENRGRIFCIANPMTKFHFKKCFSKMEH